MSEFVELPGGRLLSIPAWTFAVGGDLDRGTLRAKHADGHVAVVLMTDEDAARRHQKLHPGGEDFAVVSLPTREELIEFIRSVADTGVSDVLVDPSVGSSGWPCPIGIVLRILVG
jgi:hypothetical protein